MKSIKDVLDAINSDEGLRDELSMVYSLSNPMLAGSENDLCVQLFIYQSIPSDDNSEVCYGEVNCGLKETSIPEAIFKKINHKLTLNNALDRIQVDTIQISSFRDRKRVEQTITDALEKMCNFCFKDTTMISPQDIETIRIYISALKSVSSSNMLKIYSIVNPPFFAWCADVLK